jgi:hypothetical protein
MESMDHDAQYLRGFWLGSPGKTMDSTRRGNRQIAKGIGGFDRFQEYDIWIYLVDGVSPYPSEK